MPNEIVIDNLDLPLLRKQRNFLLEYPWRETSFPEEIDGLINLLDWMLDEAEGYAPSTPALHDTLF